MTRIRVCQLITELRLAGAERCVYELSSRLDRHRFDVQVVSLRGGRVADMLRDAGVKTTVLDIRGKWDVAKLPLLTQLMRDEKIEILHTHLFHADLAGRPAARLAAVPHVVHTVHVAEARFRPWQFAYARFLSGYCDKIVAVSDSVRLHHQRRSGLPKWHYQVIPNGIDVAAFERDEHARRELRQQWGVRDDQTLVAFVGRLNKQKGVDTLLSAMSHLAARGNPQQLVIAGDGPQRPMVENFVAHGEGGRHTRFVGFADNVRAIYSAADVLAMPSRWEGWPLTLAEAMANGLAPVATRVAGIKDIIVQGQSGILVEPHDSVALAEAIEQVVRDGNLRRTLADNARRQVREHHGIQDNVAAHEKLYEQIVEKK